MLQRLKKMLRKEKGFTLVELLAVIVILWIILAIAIPAIGNVIGSSEGKADEANIDLILNAARLADVNGDFTESSMSVSDLEKDGYLEEIPVVPGGSEDEVYTGSVTKETDGTFTYLGNKNE